MFDLDLNFCHEAEMTAILCEAEESGTSNSSVLNTEGCNSSNAGDDDSSSAAGAGDSFRCFNFDFLKVGETVDLSSSSNDEDRTSQTRSEFVTRQLFPLSHGAGQQVNSFMLCPDDDESQQKKLVHVRQQKPIVQLNQEVKKNRRGPRSRSSQYRGVTFYRRTGRWESHIWDCGKQVYLGGFDTSHDAARAYDRAAIKFRGVDADINFSLNDYEEYMNQTVSLSKEEFVQILRRQSTGFSRGNSKYRGVTLNNKCGTWAARMGQFLGKKAYDEAAIKCNGREAVEVGAYEGETVSASNHGSNYNLDLNLGLSIPSRNQNLDQMLANCLHDTRRLQVVNPSSRTVGMTSLKKQQITSEPYPSWNFFHKYKGAASSGFPAPLTSNIHWSNRPI